MLSTARKASVNISICAPLIAVAAMCAADEGHHFGSGQSVSNATAQVSPGTTSSVIHDE
jgi:hypothetical protein